MKPIVAIKRYMEADPHGRTVEMAELKELTTEERNELGELCCVELGQPFEPTGVEAA